MPYNVIKEGAPMDNRVKFRNRMDRMSPEFQELQELFRAMVPDPQQIVIRTALTCDTVNPWGTDNAGLERDISRMHEGKQF
jgi:hypothetical protein